MGAQLYPRDQDRLNDVQTSLLTRNEEIQSVTLRREGYADSVLEREECDVWIDFLTSETINAARYCETLTKLKSDIRRQIPGLLN
ncbi:hypothetical protein AVEN_216769-1 [Araneus ventricosus]|uniref:Uncharacterized protein n=1 Tax=Araneus ventricosus TaxID=182803 RepID=A0A4Y1ZNG1_ARAVE|nr:hypothetical protein AVEN_216769-1 [Araneus ventricosus]